MRAFVVVIAALAVALVSAAPVAAQDVKPVDITGHWEMTVDSPQGQLTIAANFKQDGETLTGTHVSEMGEVPLKGTVKGVDVEYTLTLDMGGQQMTIVHKGKVEGDKLTAEVDTGGFGVIPVTGTRQ